MFLLAARQYWICPSELKPGTEGGGDAGIVDDNAEQLLASFVLHQANLVAVDNDLVFKGEFLAGYDVGFAQFFLVELGIGFGPLAASDNGANGDA